METFYHSNGSVYQCIYQSGKRFYLDSWQTQVNGLYYVVGVTQIVFLYCPSYLAHCNSIGWATCAIEEYGAIKKVSVFIPLPEPAVHTYR